jgi:tetratricopeptide (TPR) repeat protein
MRSQSLEVEKKNRKSRHQCRAGGKTAARSPVAAKSGKRQPELTVSDTYLRAWAAEKSQQGNYTEAIALLSQLLYRCPENAIDYNNRGLVYFQAGQLDRAIADYNRALDINPLLAKAYNNRANYYAACGNLLAALADYDRALDLNPSYVRALLNRGITLRDLGRYEAAIESFDIALLLGQLEGHIYAERGRTYHLWGDWNCCVSDYRRALDLLPQYSSANTDPAIRLRAQVEAWLNQLLTSSN